MSLSKAIQRARQSGSPWPKLGWHPVSERSGKGNARRKMINRVLPAPRTKRTGAMLADVEKPAKHPVMPAHHDNFFVYDDGDDIASQLGLLGMMSGVMPAAVKDLALFRS
ncbi:MAG: hypothetical protein GJ676_00390 [Rhodobacteraceae bacterium]|nr:hypothetical protein [Paracoccaceae bacterium]